MPEKAQESFWLTKPDKRGEFSKAYLHTHQKVFPKGTMSKPSTPPETMPLLLHLHF